jgi:hyperosmotically inducible periplasmic protein
MKRYLFLAVIPALCWLGCDKDNTSSTTQTTAATQAAPDNTKVNERDRAPTYTPMDQSNDALDLRMTQQIRQSLVGDDQLSMDAKNIKVITQKGFVILRGPVKTDAEKQRIEAMALGVAGSPAKLDSELQVETQ